MVQICAKCLISRLKIGGALAVSLVAMITATLILFLDVVLRALRNEFGLHIFSGSLIDSFVFTMSVFQRN